MSAPIHIGQDVKLFERGKLRPSAWSAEDMNVLARWIKALANARVSPETAGQFAVSDGNFVLDLGPLIAGGTSTFAPGEILELLIFSAPVTGLPSTPSGDYVVGFTVFLPINSLAQVGGTATLTTISPHGIAMGQQIEIYVAGATPSAYNGRVLARATGSTSLTYAISSGTSTPATGTIIYYLIIYAAKPWKLRCSRTTETGADGTVRSLTYAAQSGCDSGYIGTPWNVVRTKDTETEVVAPEWLPGDIIYAAPCTTTVPYTSLISGGGYCPFILVGESRNWTAFT